MRVPVCPLIVSLSVLVLCFPNPRGAAGQTSVARAQPTGGVRGYHGQGRQRALKQSPGTVNVRPRVPAAQPGVPEVKVTVDRKRVPLGDEVTFTLMPASVVLNPRYTVTIYFGDGTSQRVRQTEIAYLYRATGTYTYSILVKSAEPPAEDIPRVSLSANPTRVVTQGPVVFTAQLSQSYPNIRYRFVFGDRNQTDWQEKTETTHAYKSPGSYLAYVDIGAMSTGSVKPLGGSVRQPIEVISPSPRPVSVTLSVNPRSVEVKQPATFVARVDSSEPNIRYRFDFGDRSGSTAWQVSPQTTHSYSVRGTYPARVDVQVINSPSGRQIASSNPLSIEVKPATPAAVAVDLIVEPRSVLAGLPVFFRATTASANSSTRYRFNFGDGSPTTAWKETPQATHIYSLAGDYPAFVEVGSSSNQPIQATAASGRKQVRVDPIIPSPLPTPSPSQTVSPPIASPETPSPTPEATPSTSGGGTSSPSATASPSDTPTPRPTPNGGGSSNNWWKYLLAALILFGVYQGWKALYAPRPTLVPNVDPGVSQLGSEGGPLAINFQMELNPNVTDGQVTVNTDGGSLIKSERKSDA
jgi:PKD repeat protein